MIDLVIYYILGSLISSCIIIIWNFSGISIHLLSRFYKDKIIVTVLDMGDAIAEKHPTISELLYCPLCLGFWVSGLIASLFYYFNNLNWLFIPCCAFSWPLIIFIFFKLLDERL